MKSLFERFSLLFMTCLLTACVQNQVTGERTLQFYDADWERQVGAQLYAPMRQSQGGDYPLDPELTAYVQSVGQRLAKQARRKDALQFEFRVINDSTPNAWALPGGKIAIHRGLLTELDSETELAAVLGHEIVHADAAHSARQQSKGLLTQIGAVAGMILIDSKVDSSAGKQAAAIVPALGAQLLSQSYSRDAEREADEYGMHYMSEAGYDPQGAVELQETFVRLSKGRPDDWMSGLFASHPPSAERVENNRSTAAGLPTGGDNGRARYQQKIQALMRRKPAYDAYDQAMQAAARDQFPSARKHLDRALALEPGESLFHVMDGDLKEREGQHKSALAAYNRAIERYNGFFYHHLRRGNLHYEMGQASAARKDLDRSIELLPTTRAHYLLGNLDRDAGNRQAAIYHYRTAAQSDSETGRLAERELILMDAQANPSKYVASGGAADANGRVYCLLRNQTRSPVSEIRVAAQFIDDGGTTRETRKTHAAVLQPAEQGSVAMGWKTSQAGSMNRRLACVVESFSLPAAAR